MINPERARGTEWTKKSSLKGGSVYPVRLPHFHLRLYLPTFWTVRNSSSHIYDNTDMWMVHTMVLGTDLTHSWSTHDCKALSRFTKVNASKLDIYPKWRNILIKVYRSSEKPNRYESLVIMANTLRTLVWLKDRDIRDKLLKIRVLYIRVGILKVVL